MSISLGSFETRLQSFNIFLSETLPDIKSEPVKLHEALHYVVFNGGKRLRPLLIYLTGEIFNTPAIQLHQAACAVELIHTYSLVHDDLPAMDDDDFRRGKPTCHKVFGEATAILVGDALQALAFELLARPNPHILPEKSIRMICELAQAIGSQGMVGGQALDISSEGKTLDITEVERLHRWKTGALIEVSIKLGILGSSHVDQVSADHLLEFAHCFGLGFQIRDDIRDIEEDRESLGKSPKGDIARQKATYPAVVGLKQARETLNILCERAHKSLEIFGDRANGLNGLLRFIFPSLNFK